MNNEVKSLQLLVNYKIISLIHEVNIRILPESLEVSKICDSQYPRGKCLAPAVKIPHRRPCEGGSFPLRLGLSKN